jgi:hypothetical protein
MLKIVILAKFQTCPKLKFALSLVLYGKKFIFNSKAKNTSRRVLQTTINKKTGAKIKTQTPLQFLANNSLSTL